MNRIVILITMFVTLFGFSCAVMTHSPIQYKGRYGAMNPYVQLDTNQVNNVLHTCERMTNSCSVSSHASPWIHNPTLFIITGVLTCTYELNDREVSSTSTKLLTVPPQRSMRVDMYRILDIPNDKPTDVTVGCYFRYKKNNFRHKSFHDKKSQKKHLQ